MAKCRSEKIELPVLPPLKRNKVGRLYAPHKPVLLLAVIDLIEAGEIRQPRFEVTGSLVEAFSLEWKRHVSTVGCFVARPWNPIHHIEDEIIHRELQPGKNPARFATITKRFRPEMLLTYSLICDYVKFVLPKICTIEISAITLR